MSRPVGIQIFDGDSLVESLVFDRDIIKIGRLASAQVRIDDDAVSRIHAVIDISAGRDEVSVIDMGGKPATRVNGEEISRTKIKHGDVIEVCQYRLVVALDEAAIQELQPEDTAVKEPPVAPMTEEASDEATLVADSESSKTDPVETEEGGSWQDSFAPGPLSEMSLPEMSQERGSDEGGHIDLPQAGETEVFTRDSLVNTAPSPGSLSPSSAAVETEIVRDTGELQAALAETTDDVDQADFSENQPHGHIGGPELPPVPVDPITGDNRYMEVSLRWGGTVVQVDRIRKEKSYVIGNASEANMAIPVDEDLSADVFTLLSRGSQDEWVLHVPPGVKGELIRGDASTPLGEADSLTFEDDMVAVLPIGTLTIEVRSVSKSRVVPVIPFLDTFFLNVVVASLISTVFVLSALILVPSPLDDDMDDLFANVNEFKAMILKQQKKNEFLERFKEKQSQAAQKKDKGKRGDKKSKSKSPAKTQIKKQAPTKEEVVQKKLDELFGGSGENSGLAAMFDTNSGGSELQTLLGGIAGASEANMFGAGGLGIRGAGPGGGGTGTTSYGTGRVGTVGRGSGNSSYGRAVGGLGKKKSRDIQISTAQPLILGSLDKDIIKRVIRENMQQIRYCYERELSKTPGIYGKVKMKWVITAEGRVSQSQVAETQMKNAAVENCMKRRIKTWRFPKPKGGGIVLVTYPFIFRQSN